MSGALIDVDLSQFEGAGRQLADLAGFDRAELMEGAAAILESSTRMRLDETKEDADGGDWPAWSKRYAKTRRVEHSLLVGEGELLDSIASFHETNQAGVGSNMIYAASHQFGDEDRGIPERAYLGVSDEDRGDILDLIDRTLMEPIQ